MTSIVFEFLRLIDEISLILLVVSLLFYIILSVSLYKIYKKNNMNATRALIPIYNIISLLELVDLPKFLIVVIFVPYINILGIIITNLMIGWRVSKAFKCNFLLTFCLIILPFVGYPLIAIKNLEYHQLKSSPKLFVKKVVEEKKEETIDIPKYDIDMSNIRNVSAVGINEFLNQEHTSKPTTSNYSPNINEVEDLTFDYNQIYTNDISNEEEKSKMNYDLQNNQFYNKEADNLVVPVEPVIPEPIQDLPIAPVEPVIPEPVQDIPVVPVETVIPEPVQDIPVVPVETVIPEPVQDIPVVPVEPVIPEPVQDIPIAPVEPVIPEPVQNIPEVSVEPLIPGPIQDIPMTPVEPVIPEPVQNIPEVSVEPVIPESVQNIPEVSVEPLIPEPVQDIPAAPVEPIIPEPIQDIPVVPVEPIIPESVQNIPEVSVEPVIPESAQNIPVVPVEPIIPEPIQDIPMTPVEPVIPEPVQDIPVVPVEPVIPEPVQDIPVVPVEPVIPGPVQDIPMTPVEPVIPEPLTDSYDTNIIESVIPEEKEEIPQFNNNKPKPYSKDGYTFDYNSLYNISPSEDQSVIVNKEIKKKEIEEVDPLKSLQMAAPPSFDTPVKVEKKEEEKPTPMVPEINKADLVSINIKEPDVLPVGTLGRKKINKNSTLASKDGVVFAHPPTTNNVNINNLLRNDNSSNYSPNGRNNVMGMPNNNGNRNNSINSRNNVNVRGSNQSNNVYGINNNTNGNSNINGYVNNVPNRNPRDNGNRNMPFNNSPYNSGRMVPNSNINYNLSNNQNRNSGSNTFNNPSYRNNAMYSSDSNANNMNFSTQSSLLRPNEDSRAYMSSNQSRGKSKFISNDDNKYTLPKSEPLPVQMPTDPNLIANPMAIFGSNSSVLRPTAGEAMYQNYNAQPMQQHNMPNSNGTRSAGQHPMNNTCPNCGFVIKPGQPSCVVCGYRLM